METSAIGSQSMDLKVRELLKEVHLDYSTATTKFVDDTISAIREAIEKIPEDFKVGAHTAPGFVRDVGADKVDFTFKKPKAFEIVGSYSIRAVARPDLNVDLLLRMPKECFLEKDYLNHRYHAKRCLYLCVIKKYLELSPLFQTIEWSTFQDEARKPVLIVYPVQKLVELPSFFVRLIPAATSLFSVSKLRVTRNNLRNLNQEGNAPQATPKYNSSILEDMFLEQNAEYVKKNFQGWKELGEALLLLKVWARQRNSIYIHDCLSGYLISVILSYLASESGGNRINRSMKAIQIFRVTVDFIATSKLWDRGLLCQPHGQSIISKEGRRQYLQSFPAVIFDSSAHFNLAFRLTRSALLQLRDEAVLTLNCLDKCRDGGFEEIFMTRVDFPAKYDYYMRLNLIQSSEVHEFGFCLDDECWRRYEERVHNLLEQGLSDRAKSIRVTRSVTPSEWNVEEGFLMFERKPLFVGISASTIEKSFRVVDVGPSADNKAEVLKFRRFWGEKAELRRFKDGTIAESTVWECEQWQRHLIIKRITEHILQHHLSISKESMVHVVDQLDFCLLDGLQDPISNSGSLLEAFESLSKCLRGLEGIPLRVSSVQPLDSAFRFTSVFPPRRHPFASEKDVTRRLQQLSTCIQPMEVMIQLEGSGNWPMDNIVIEKTKSAFLLKIGETLQNKWGMTCTATEDVVDVLMFGYAFRLRILHERGLNLLKREAGNGQMKHISSIDKDLFIRSQHSSMINGLLGHYPMYGPVVRLAKRWVASHLFSDSVAEEGIELMVAYLFLKPLPFYAPCSRVTGFLRFLRLLSDYDWTFSALIVDVNSDLTSMDEKEINENFMLSRKSYEENAQDVNPAMFLATSYDKASEAWTRFSPSSSELKRIVAYARSSADFLAKLILEDQTDSRRWESIFRTPLNNYDAVILLHGDRLPFPQRLLFTSEVNHGRHVAQGSASKDFDLFLSGSLEEMKKKFMVDFDPMRCFVDDLKKEFPEIFKLWYDALGGDAIGLTWERRGAKKRGREDFMDEKRDLNNVLKGVGEVGRGLVRSIYFLKAPRLK